MGNYNLNHGLLEESSNPSPVPIKAKRGAWKLKSKPVRYVRTFKFAEVEDMANFIQDVLAYEEDTQHHGKTTIEYPFVKMEVWTHDLNNVTEIDKEWTEAVDKIYSDYR